MMQFAQIFDDEQIVVSLIRQLSWTHFIALIPIKDELQRDFYAPVSSKFDYLQLVDSLSLSDAETWTVIG
jgi:hypothetical protein